MTLVVFDNISEVVEMFDYDNKTNYSYIIKGNYQNGERKTKHCLTKQSSRARNWHF